MSKISDILKSFMQPIVAETLEGEKALSEAEQQLKQYFKEEMLKLVNRKTGLTVKYEQMKGFELLRAELRQAIDKWEG